MPYFTLVFNDNSTQVREADTKDLMIKEYTKNDCTSFQEKVKEIQWQEANVHFREIISSGEIIEESM